MDTQNSPLPFYNFVEVSNISPDTSKYTIEDLFSQCGKIVNFNLCSSGVGQEARISFDLWESQCAALFLDGTLLLDARIRVFHPQGFQILEEEETSTKSITVILQTLVNQGYRIPAENLTKAEAWDIAHSSPGYMYGGKETLTEKITTTLHGATEGWSETFATAAHSLKEKIQYVEEGLINTASSVTHSIGEKVIALEEGLVHTASAVTSGISHKLHDVKEDISQKVHHAYEQVPSAKEVKEGISTNVVAPIQGKAEAIKETVIEKVGVVQEKANEMYQNLPSTEEVKTRVSDKAHDIKEEILHKVAPLQEKAEAVSETVKEKVSEVYQQLPSVQDIKEGVSEKVGLVSQGISESVTKAKESISGTASQIKETVQEKYEELPSTEELTENALFQPLSSSEMQAMPTEKFSGMGIEKFETTITEEVLPGGVTLTIVETVKETVITK